MSNQLTVSIITVTFNCVKYVERAIQSVCTQTYPNIEYLIIDGCSTDGTIDVINRYHDNIDCFISEKDSGIYNAMNKGIKNASGDILFFLNADDRFTDSGVVDDIVNEFNKNPDMDLIYGDVVQEFPDARKRWIQSTTLSRIKLAMGTISHQSIFAKKELFIITNGFSEQYKIVGDFVWLMKLAHLNINSMHLKRDITIVCTEGVSNTTEWENERLIAMRQHYSTIEIFFLRILPRKIGIIIKYIKKIIR